MCIYILSIYILSLDNNQIGKGNYTQHDPYDTTSMDANSSYLCISHCRALYHRHNWDTVGVENIFHSSQGHNLHRQKHDDVIKWKHFRVTGPLSGEFSGHRGIPRTKASDAGLWFFFICVWINSWINIRGAGDLRRSRAHYDVIVMM